MFHVKLFFNFPEAVGSEGIKQNGKKLAVSPGWSQDSTDRSAPRYGFSLTSPESGVQCSLACSALLPFDKGSQC